MSVIHIFKEHTLNIVVIGAGYVGLVTSACFAELGNTFVCVVVNGAKVENLNNDILPIYEPGLESMIKTNRREGRLFFATTLSFEKNHPDVIFIAVGTPSDNKGDTELKYVLSAARNIGQCIKQYCVIVDKSTVPVGMAEKVKDVINQALAKRNLLIPYDVVSNPEFLREGAAIEDFMRPDRVIIGLASHHAKQIMLDLYLPLLRNPERIFFMSVKEAEMTKYAANAMLATRISFMNEIALLCERLDVDIEKVRLGLGSDSRIGGTFLNAGCGYGGSCFPKDVRALIKMAEQQFVDPLILRAVESRNLTQKNILATKIVDLFGEDLSSYCIALWGLAFKPGTDDMREASSIVLLEALMQRGAKVQAYDPAAMPQAQKILPRSWFESGQLSLAEHQYDALKQVDLLVLVTEWQSFCYPDIAVMKKLMRQLMILDGRNQYDPRHMQEAGFYYDGIGRGQFKLPSSISKEVVKLTG